MPEQLPLVPERPDRKNTTRIIIAVLAITLLILLGVNFLGSPSANILSGKANVSGRVSTNMACQFRRG